MRYNSNAGIQRDLATLNSQDYDSEEEEDGGLSMSAPPPGTSTFHPTPPSTLQHQQQQQQQQQPPGSFRRAAPVMGNRSLETYRQHHERSRSKSKSSPKDASSSSRASPRSSHREAGRRQSGSSSRAQDGGGGDGAVQVAALDERNLKRAVNRYGTMPKGARIGAYLESLRQSGMTPEPVTDQGVESDATLDSSSQGGDTLESNGRPPHPHFQHSSLNKSKQPVSAAAAAQMLRSNSSHGGFGGGVGGGGGGGGGRGSPIQRTNPNHQLRRALTSGIDTPMRGATATAAAQQQLPGEEFLPPPPQGEGLSHWPAPPVHFLANRRPSPSPRARRKDSANKENLPERLKSGRIRGSDEEGSDPDRSSLQSPAAVQAAASAAASHPYQPPPAPNAHFATPKSPTSPASECRTLGSPAVGSLGSPGSTMDDGRMAGARKNSSGSGPTDAIRPFSKAKLEQKLVDELKAKEAAGGSGGAHQKQPSCDSLAPTASESGPASLLVCELAESIKSKGQRPKSPLLEKQPKASDGDDVKKHEVDFKANLRKVKRPDSDEATHAKSETNPNPHEIDFKSNLKKTPKAAPSSASGKSHEKAGNEGDPARAAEEPNIVDFKAKLKKPKPMVPAEVANSGPAQQQQAQQGADQLNFKARLRKVSGDKPGFTVMEGEGKGAGKNGVGRAKDAPEAEDDKRKSTGSISSLRKMWESSDQKKGKTALPDSNPTSPTSETNSESRSVKFEKRVWPPVPSTETEKPMVPVKPTMKPAAPTSKPPPPTSKPPPPTTKPPAAKPHPLCNIYAAPTQVRPKPGAKPAIASKPPPSVAAGAAAGAAATSATRSGSAGEASGDSGGGSSTATEKDFILSSSQTLESKLTAAKAMSSVQLSTSSLMQLCDSVGSFHSSCASFADNVTPTGRFRFRSLLSKLEEQTQNLRSGAHCIDDIHSTVRDLVTVIQR